MRAPDVRETFDQFEFMLDGPALRFGILLGSETGQLVGPRVATLQSDILVNLLGRSSLL